MSTTTQESPWYDDYEALYARLGLGLTGLRQIIEARYDAQERKEQLGEWCLLGFIWLDRLGNTRCIKTGAPAELATNRCWMVVSGAEIYTAEWTMTGSYAFPDESSVCDRCGRGWTLQNLRDHYPYRTASDDKICHRHKRCQELLVVQEGSEELRKIVDDAGIEVLSTALIPSQYDGDTTYFGPWMVVTTPHGRLEIGWRKRVISIDWKQMNIVVPATLFAAEDAKRITRLEAGIHAYGVEHAVDILRRVWSCTIPRVPFRAGDVVLHHPTGETWVLATDEEDRGGVWPAGWPETLAYATECELVEAASDEARMAMLETASKGESGGRRATAAAQLAALRSGEAVP